MHRGGSRWSVAIGVLFVVSLLMPAAADASTPVTLTLAVSSTSEFSDVPLTFTITASPAVAGITVHLVDETTPVAPYGAMTSADGTATLTFTPAQQSLLGSQVFSANTVDDGTFGAATSNTVQVDLQRHDATVSLTALVDGVPTVLTDLDDLYLLVVVHSPDCDGQLDIEQLPSGLVDHAYPSLIYGGGSVQCGASVHLGPEPIGDYTFEADYSGSFTNNDASTGPVPINVTLIPTTTVVSSTFTSMEAGTTTWLSAQVTAPVHTNLVYGSGTVTFFDGTTNLGSAPLQNLGDGTATINVELDSVGTHKITAQWSGTSEAAASTSPALDISVVTNLAHAVDLGPSASTVYPVVDGFGDSVSFRGELDEPESVAITIANSKGTVVRRLAVAMRDVGDYSVAWNGRKASSSTIVPAGAYKVTTVVTDALGAHLTFTDKVTVSPKKLVWHTVTATLAGDRFKARGGSAGKVTASPVYRGGARITLPFIMGEEYYALGYQFTLPTATRYSGLTFSVLGSGSVVDIGLQDKRLGNWPSGSSWIVDYFAPLKEVPTRYGWTAISGNVAYNMLGHTVRGVVLDTGYGHYDVADVRLKYRYALLE